MSFQLGQQIEFLNAIPWIKGMVVNSTAEISADVTRFEGRIVYVKLETDKYWFVDSSGVPRKLRDLFLQHVDNIKELKEIPFTLRQPTKLVIVHHYDVNDEESDSASPQLMLYAGGSILTNTAWENTNNWIEIGANTGSGTVETTVSVYVENMSEINGEFKKTIVHGLNSEQVKVWCYRGNETIEVTHQVNNANQITIATNSNIIPFTVNINK